MQAYSIARIEDKAAEGAHGAGGTVLHIENKSRDKRFPVCMFNTTRTKEREIRKQYKYVTCTYVYNLLT